MQLPAPGHSFPQGQRTRAGACHVAALKLHVPDVPKRLLQRDRSKPWMVVRGWWVRHRLGSDTAAAMSLPAGQAHAFGEVLHRTTSCRDCWQRAC